MLIENIVEKRRNCSLKILWKRGEILLFSTIFCNLFLDFNVKTGTRYLLRDKRLFEINEVEIMRVDCISEDTQDITTTRLYNFDPLKPHFYIVKLGFTGVYIIFLISAQNIDCGYSLEPPR